MDCLAARTSNSGRSELRAFFIDPFPREIATALAAPLQDRSKIVRRRHFEMEGFIRNGAIQNPHRRPKWIPPRDRFVQMPVRGSKRVRGAWHTGSDPPPH
jgi:hypothetical protein